MYVGHFSFDVAGGGSALETVDDGDFTLLAEAESADEALEKFSALIELLDDSFEGFDSVGDVYLDSVSEIKKLPPEGVLSYFTQRSDDGRADLPPVLRWVRSFPRPS